MGVLQAFGLGFISQSSLLIAGLLACWVKVPRILVGILAGFGAGALLSAVSFDLIAEAEHLDSWQFSLWMLIGVAVFLVGDRVVEKRFGASGSGAAMGIVVGSVVDGVPESIIFGIQIGTGFPISAAFLAAVFVSNIPQAIAPSADLSASGWGASQARRALVRGGTCLRGRGRSRLPRDQLRLGSNGRSRRGAGCRGSPRHARELAYPLRFRRGGEWAGVATTVGFCVSLLGS